MPTSDSATAQRPRVPTGQELYDQIMAHIEPELTSEGLLTVKEKYKTETPEQFAARKQRYVQAFERYDQAYQGYLATLQTQVDLYRKESIGRVELDDRSREQDALRSISQSWQ